MKISSILEENITIQFAREGALKIKEIAYVHSEGSRGGELKHGELALISEDIPSICIVPTDSVYEKMVSNIEEIRARKGLVIAIVQKGTMKSRIWLTTWFTYRRLWSC